MHEINVKVSKHDHRRYYVMWYVDPVTEKRIQKSTKKTTLREAERAAGEWETELRSESSLPDRRITWEAFVRRYDAEKLSALSPRTQDATDTAFNHLENLIGPKRLMGVTAEALSSFQAKLRDRGLAETSIHTHLRHIRAALSWAEKVGLLAKVPKIDMPKAAKGQTLMRGRPITLEEFERMLTAVPKVRQRQPDRWQRYLRGLWLSGLRLGESLIVSWEVDAPFAIDLTGKHPRFRIYAEAHKGRRDVLLPMTPDFATFLLETPEEERHGHVFRIGAKSRNRVGHVISKIGREAKVVIDKAKNQFASAHDLRRSFGTRWAKDVMPATLQRLMRHQNIDTTMKYYVDQDADDIAAKLWAGYNLVTPGQNRAPEAAESEVDDEAKRLAAKRLSARIQSRPEGKRIG
jgi:integrase